MFGALSHLVRIALCFVLLLLLPAVCQAQTRAAGEPASAEPKTSLWRGPNFTWQEGLATIVAGATTAALALRPQPTEARWTGGILFDDAIRNAVRLESGSGRQRARRVGDLTYYAAPLLPLIVDPLLVALLARDDGKAALNLELVGLEAFSYAGLLSFVSTRISVRERPDATECRRQHPDRVGCDRDTEAFWSGHTSIVSASAGLVCANHRYLALWGSPAADASACALAATSALVTGVTRLAADRHYASDVIVGMGVGFGFGYAVPVLLHYAKTESRVRLAIEPDALGSGATVSVGGAF